MRFTPLVALAVIGTMTGTARAELPRLFGPDAVTKLNRTLAGELHDYTANHGRDRRVESKALGEQRDVYAYTPPGYDVRTPLPFMLYLHGFGQDEKSFLDIVGHFDAAMQAGRCPKMVIVAPDGSLAGRQGLLHAGSFYVNSEAGRFGDYIAADVWEFAHKTFALCPNREAHVIAGASMGGFGAFNVAFKNKAQYAHVIGIMPPLNLRYGDSNGRYLTAYDPTDFALRPVSDRGEIVGQFGLLRIRSRRMLDPLVGKRADDVTDFIARENPFEMLTSHAVKPGDFNLFVGYGTRDEFNIHAATESFLDEAGRRGIAVETVVVPDGRHNVATAVEMLPSVNRWLADRLGTPPDARRTAHRVVLAPHE